MRISRYSHRLRDVRERPSPNCDDRPNGVQPELIVVHSISLPPAEYGGELIDDLFLNKLDPDAHPYFREIAHLKVSAHVMISRVGVITQYVPFSQRAWHAGESTFDGRVACNDFSIGIELEGTDTDAFTSVQYWQLASVIQVLRETYPSLHDCAVVGHSDIAPGRKTDPGGGFEWSRLNRLLDALGSV